MSRFTEILSQVHSKPCFEAYEETNIRDNTNCYSHALGATLPYLECYRVGALCGEKSTDEPYFSTEEIKKLLFFDCDELQLKIEESSLDEELLDNQYKIKLFVKIWANGEIADYHFWRFEDGTWTEKWKARKMSEIQDFEKSEMNYFPWNLVGIYKISR